MLMASYIKDIHQVIFLVVQIERRKSCTLVAGPFLLMECVWEVAVCLQFVKLMDVITPAT